MKPATPPAGDGATAYERFQATMRALFQVQKSELPKAEKPDVKPKLAARRAKPSA